jgi:hypothetical protein
MIELDTSYSLSQIPYITNEALDEYATRVVADAQHEVMKEPTALDVDRFLEFYLGLNVEFKRLSYNSVILGMTAFNAGIVHTIDESTNRITPILVEAGTVIIEPSLMNGRNLARRRFTYMHEGSHWLLHRKAFSTGNPFGSAGKYDNQYLAAKEGRIDYCRAQTERNDLERMERQADFLAAALLMPLPTLRMAFREFFNYVGERPRKIIRGQSDIDDCYAQLLSDYVAKRFGVSKRAALIRLEKLGGIAGKAKRAWING